MALEDPQKEKFCVAYVSDISRNGTQAAIDAGYTEQRNSAAVQASRLLKDVKVKARIRELEREMWEASGYDGPTFDRAILREFAKIAFSDVTDVVHISPGHDDPRRAEVMDALAAINGGQRLLDFGETVMVPTPNLNGEATAAIKSIKTKMEKGGRVSIDIDMHNKIQALESLARIRGLETQELRVSGGLQLNSDEKENILMAAKELTDHVKDA